MDITQITDSNKIDFFISYTEKDTAWANWVAWELEREKFSYRMQSEHFPPGSRFMHEMRQFIQNSDQLIAILSPAYFESPFASLEFNSIVAEDPLGIRRRVIPVKVMPCTMPSIFSDLVYIDLVGKSDETEARRALVAGIKAAKVGIHSEGRGVKERPKWPPSNAAHGVSSKTQGLDSIQLDSLPVRIQFFACDVGRGLDLRGQYAKLKAVLEASTFSSQFKLQPEFDVTDANLFTKLNSYRPHVVHISGNQNGGDVLLPASDGGEIVVPDVALAGLLSSLGRDVRLVIIDTCESYACAKRVSEVVDCTIGVDDEISDEGATRFYEVFYQAVAAGHSFADAHGQAVAALQFMGVPLKGIPKLCVKEQRDASQMFLVKQ